MNPTAMSRAFSKWWDRRKVAHGNRAEASTGWEAGVQWALEQAALRLEEGLTLRESDHVTDDERRLCVDDVRDLAKKLQR